MHDSGNEVTVGKARAVAGSWWCCAWSCELQGIRFWGYLRDCIPRLSLGIGLLLMYLTLVRLAAATCLPICVGLRCPGVLCDLACASGNLEV